MSNIVNRRSLHEAAPSSRHDFLPVYPTIQRHAMVVFRHLPPVEREEAVAEAVAAGFCSFVRLKAVGKDPTAFPNALAKFAVLWVKSGRPVGTKINSRDVLSRRAQQCRGFHVESLHEGRWNDLLAGDAMTPIPEQISFRLDWADFLGSLSGRHRRIIHALALGHAAKWVANKFSLSPARVTQLRKGWRRQWQEFLGEVDDRERMLN
jgi:hypothetical protein